MSTRFVFVGGPMKGQRLTDAEARDLWLVVRRDAHVPENWRTAYRRFNAASGTGRGRVTAIYVHTSLLEAA